MEGREVRGHKPAIAEIEEAVHRQWERVRAARIRFDRQHAGPELDAARRVLFGASGRLTELERQLAEARREVEGLREPATFVCGAGAEQDASLEVRRPILSGDPGDEDEHVSARRGVQIHVGLIMQYRSRFVHATPESADEFAARQRVGLLQGRLQELIDDGVLEGYKVESVEFDMLPKGA